MPVWSTLWAAGVCWLLPITLFANSDEDHNHERPAPALTATLEPRLEAASRELELLAVWQPDGLLIYLDRYASNEAVSGAVLTVDLDSQTLSAIPASPGLYRLIPTAGLKPGDYVLEWMAQENALYLSGHDGKDISTAGASGKIIAVGGGGKTTAVLTPAGGNRLNLSAPLPTENNDVKAVISITLPGHAPVQARLEGMK